MTLSAIGILILALICAWTFGGIALRLAGILIVLAGLFGLSLTAIPMTRSSSPSASASGSLGTFISASATALKGALADRLCLSATSVCQRALAIVVSVGASGA